MNLLVLLIAPAGFFLALWLESGKGPFYIHNATGRAGGLLMAAFAVFVVLVLAGVIDAPRQLGVCQIEWGRFSERVYCD